MGKDHAKAKDAADTGVKSGFTNPMHLDIDLEDAGKELVTPSDDKISSPLRDSFYPGEEPAKSPKVAGGRTGQTTVVHVLDDCAAYCSRDPLTTPVHAAAQYFY